MRCCSCMAQICNLKSPSSNLPFCQEKNFFGICKQSVSFTDKEEGGSCAEETTEEDQAWLGLSFLDFQLASARVLLNTATKWEKFYKPFTEWLRVPACYDIHMLRWHSEQNDLNLNRSLIRTNHSRCAKSLQKNDDTNIRAQQPLTRCISVIQCQWYSYHRK